MTTGPRRAEVPGTGLSGQTIGNFLDLLAARVPAPGGGASAALHAAQAAALLGMVARYTTGERYAEHADVVTAVCTEADRLRGQCLALADADADAFTAVGAAYRLARSTPAEEEHRRAAVAAALLGAATPPGEVIRAAAALVALGERLLPVANRTVLTDVAAATDAARAAATTARLNVEVDLGGIQEETARAGLLAVVASVDDVVRRCDALHDAVREVLRG